MAQTWPVTLYTSVGAISEAPVIGGPMPSRHSSLRVIVGKTDITERHNGLTFTNVARGGLESLQVQPQRAVDLRVGDPIKVWLDNERAWWGSVNDPGDQSKMDRGQAVVAGVGPGYVLKENPYREIYCDRDLSKWGSPPAARDWEFTNGGHVLSGQISVGFDDGSSPAQTNHTGAQITWALDRLEIPGANYAWNEAWYDSQQIPIGAIYYDYNSYDQGAGGAGLLGAAAAPWSAIVRATNRNNAMSSASYYDESADLADGTGQKTGYVTTTDSDRIYGMLIQRYLAGGVTSGAGVWRTFWRNVAVYGRHGLGRQGADPGGFYPHQIAADALKRVYNTGILPQLTEATTFILRHYLADNKVPEAVIDDMAKFMGWYWGVWEPAGFDDRPRLLFHPPRPSANCSVAWSQCQDGEAPRVRLDLLYDQCRVAYQDASGKSRYTTVSKANPHLRRSRRMEISMGTANSAEAAIYGQFALALAQTAQRGSGWVILPEYVDTQSGPRPSALLRAGRDRIRMTGLPLVSSMLDTDARSDDTFHIQKVEVTVQPSGSIQTRVEFDGGADLLDTLQLRAEEALIVHGVS